MAAHRIESGVTLRGSTSSQPAREWARVLAGIASILAFPLAGMLHLAGVVDELLYVLIAAGAIGILVAAGR